MLSILRSISQNDGFREFIQEFTADFPYLEQQTHGVRLAVDEYWMDWWYLTNYPILPHPVRQLDLSRWRALLSAMGYQYPTRQAFIARQPPNWNRYCVSHGWPRDSLPFRIIFSLRPGTFLREFPQRQRRNWQSDGIYPIEYEVRPLVQGHAQHRPTKPVVGGVSLGPGSGIRIESGTLGGIAHHGNASIAFTCAHVFGEQAVAGDEVWHPAASDDGRAARVGAIRTICHPTPRTGQFCNRTATYASASDVTIIEFDPNVDSNLSVRQAGVLSSPRSIDMIGCYEDVVFVGKESDRREARTEQLSHFQEITIAGKVYCYQDLFTIGFRTHKYISQSLSASGDSGSWVLSDPGVSTRELLGMLVGGDGEKSFCCFAENFIQQVGFKMDELIFR